MHLKIPLMLGTLFFVILLLPEKDNLQMIVFSDKSKELDQSDNQIYSTANYSPILNITWPREREPVVEGVLESNLLPWFHHPFCKFYELVIGSSINDSFNSKVDHLGLKKTLLVHWESSALIQILEATEILVYALGVIMLLWNFILIIMFFKRSMFSTRVPMP